MLLPFPSIGQFSQFVSRYKVRENLTFSGSIKLHGTSAAIGYSKEHGLWFQSHKKIITPEADNYKFASMMTQHKEDISALMFSVAKTYSIDLDKNALILYGEFCGSNIQKGVGISGLPAMLVLFDLAFLPYDQNSNEENLKWLNLQKFPIPDSLSKIVYNIMDFETYQIEVDFKKLPEIRNQLVKLTEKVEAECPVAKHFGNLGIGEGVVWRTLTEDGKVYRFKVKGEKHATSKVTTMAAVDVEKLRTLDEFVEKSVTENRLLQGIAEIFGNDLICKSWFQKLGAFNKWVVNDVKKEDMEAFPKDLQITDKDLSRAITAKSSKWFKNYVEEQLMSSNL